MDITGYFLTAFEIIIRFGLLSVQLLLPCHHKSMLCLSTLRNLTDIEEEVLACLSETYEVHPDCVSHHDAHKEAMSAIIVPMQAQCESQYSYSGYEGYEDESEFFSVMHMFS